MKERTQIEQLAQPHVPALHAYVPGVQPTGGNWVKLNTNELPYPCSPAVGPAVQAELERLPLYPNPQSMPLRQAVAEHHGLDASRVIIGNGSDDVLNLLTRVFVGDGRAAAMTFPSYSLYPVLTAIQDGKLEEIPFTEEMELPVEAIAACQANIFFLTAPNAPTGVAFPLEQVRAAAKGFRGIFVIDEAHVDFAEESAVPLLHELENVVITRTFSKSYGLAGLRVGYALASPTIIGLLDRVRDSYNVNRLSQAGALAAIRDQAYYAGVIAQVKETRNNFIHSVRNRGFFTYNSRSNFVFTRPTTREGNHGPEVARSLFNYLQDNQVLVRYFGSSPLTHSFLRISIGTSEQMQRLLDLIDTWRKHA